MSSLLDALEDVQGIRNVAGDIGIGYFQDQEGVVKKRGNIGGIVTRACDRLESAIREHEAQNIQNLYTSPERVYKSGEIEHEAVGEGKILCAIEDELCKFGMVMNEVSGSMALGILLAIRPHLRNAQPAAKENDDA